MLRILATYGSGAQQITDGKILDKLLGRKVIQVPRVIKVFREMTVFLVFLVIQEAAAQVDLPVAKE